MIPCETNRPRGFKLGLRWKTFDRETLLAITSKMFCRKGKQIHVRVSLSGLSCAGRKIILLVEPKKVGPLAPSRHGSPHRERTQIRLKPDDGDRHDDRVRFFERYGFDWCEGSTDFMCKP